MADQIGTDTHAESIDKLAELWPTLKEKDPMADMAATFTGNLLVKELHDEGLFITQGWLMGMLQALFTYEMIEQASQPDALEKAMAGQGFEVGLLHNGALHKTRTVVAYLCWRFKTGDI